MTSRRTKGFVRLLAQLPPEIVKQAREAYGMWMDNPWHPGLRFKKVRNLENVWSVRISRDYRAVGAKSGEEIVWFWIGSHAEYDQLLRAKR